MALIPKKIPRRALLVLIAAGLIVAAATIFLNGTSSCQSNPNPVFTHSPADLSKIDYIVPPGNVETYEGSSKVLKTHSYFKGPNKVTIHAPVDSTLFRGVYVAEGGIDQYALFFRVSCEVYYILDHIVDPVEKIKNAFPDTPAHSTGSMTNTPKVEFEAGELVGYSIGEEFEQWDFGVYNETRKNDFSDLDETVPIFGRDKIADCPFDYFSEELRREFYSKFDNHLTGIPTPDRFCKRDDK